MLETILFKNRLGLNGAPGRRPFTPVARGAPTAEAG